jgi:cytohesin
MGFIDFLLGTSKLHRAAKKGEHDTVTQLLSNSFDVNQRDRDGATALHFAAHHGHSNVAALLLSKGADVNTKDSGGVPPLSVAILGGDAKLVKLFLDAGADPSVSDYAGFHAAASHGHLEIVRLLLERGVDVNAQCEGGTALHAAVCTGENNIVEALLAAGANIEAKENQTSQTALLFALDPTNPHIEAARLLISRGANVNARSKGGSTPLIFAVCNPDQAEVVSDLIAKGADVNLADNDGQTPLYWAMTQARGHSTIVDLLIQHGARQ